MFEDFKNISIYPLQKRPLVLKQPLEPLDKDFLKKTMQGLTTIMSNEWLQPEEISSSAIKICTPLHPSSALSKELRS